LNPAARDAWADYFAGRIAKRLDVPEWPSVVDHLLRVLGTDLDAELDQLTADLPRLTQRREG